MVYRTFFRPHLSDDISLLMDSERTAHDAPLEPMRAGFVAICKKVGLHHHVLERRAIENYFSDEAVKKAFGTHYRALHPYEKLKDISPAWGKSENWRIAREMTIPEVEGTDLGQFLATLSVQKYGSTL
jgi:hypothetical protein